VHKKTASLLWKLFLALASLAGIGIQSGVFTGVWNPMAFRMFTILSNLVCAVYFLAAAGYGLRHTGAFCPGWQGACLMSICLTGFVAAFLLKNAVNFHTLTGVSMFLLHVLVPIGTVLDYLVFGEKGRWSKYAPLWWLLPPYAYFAFILVTAARMPADAAGRFPYPFLDYTRLGAGRVALIAAILTALYLALGCFFRRLDAKLAEPKKPRSVSSGTEL
jgi:hypothetical protein